MEEKRHRGRPVSYTHLDVYKRQHLRGWGNEFYNFGQRRTAVRRGNFR